MKIREIKRFSTKVYDAVLRLLPQLDPGIELPAKEQFNKVLKSGGTHFFIAEPGNKKIAGMMSVVTYNVPTGIKVWIEDVVVDEAYRGKGIGKKLMAFAIDFARSSGAKSVDLTSRPWRIAANLLYQKMGFELRETNVYRYMLK